MIVGEMKGTGEAVVLKKNFWTFMIPFNHTSKVVLGDKVSMMKPFPGRMNI